LASNASARPGLLESLGLNDNDDVPPPVEEAFIFSHEIQSDGHIDTHWQVLPGNYLYKDKIELEVMDNNRVRISGYDLPHGKEKDDPLFGLTEVYLSDITAPIQLERPNEATTFTLRVKYQGCSETFGICYPPVESLIPLSLPALAASERVPNTASKPTQLSEQDQIAEKLAHDALWKIILGFLGLGLLLAFTPCVFPMIPILSSIIVGEGERITTHRAFVLSLTYVLSMSVTYTAAGILTGLLGQNLQAIFQTPWILYSFSGLFVLLALSMFGLFELQLPHFLQHRLHQLSHRQQGGKLVSVAIMGLLSGVIVGPCLAPPLAGTLIFIGQSADPVLGGIALFSLSLGMGIPLLLLGTSAGSLLPKAGDWMVNIKSIFGVLLLGLAIWMLERVIPGWLSLILWGALLVVSAVFLGAFNALQIDSTGWTKLYKGAGLALFIYGGALIVGGASGNQNVWQPLHFANNTASSSASSLNYTYIHDLESLNQRLLATQRPVFVDFYADWCTDCKTMEATTFKNATVQAALSNFDLIKIDMTENTPAHQHLLKSLSVFGPPTMLFFDNQGNEYRSRRLVGHVDAEQLLQHLASLR
jgi:thiol:disulfide interchange protein DsbD